MYLTEPAKVWSRGVLAAAYVVGTSLVATGAEERKQVTSGCASTSSPIREERFVSIGGIEQWITINGASCANPVILFLHGGPGNTLSPYADSIYGDWGKEFTLVQWDQRGAGRTYGRNPPPIESTLTIERMAEDGIELVTYLSQHLGKRKIILLAGSWGSVLGVHMAKSRPDLFHAYVGVAQIVSYRENQAASYATTIALARAATDQTTVSALEALGPPPWANPRSSGTLRRAIRGYEAKTSTPAPHSWWMRSPDYETPKMRADYLEGEEFSYLQFVGLKGDGMFSKVDLPKLGTAFEIPVFIIQGSEDLLTIPGVAKRYFDTIVAPQKEYIVVANAGHDPNVAMIDAQYKVMRERVLPLTR
jgi:pimeloyl-ACP methyl ester carboxylesterase